MTSTPIRHIRVTDEDWAAWREEAGPGGISAWVRMLCNDKVMGGGEASLSPPPTEEDQ